LSGRERHELCRASRRERHEEHCAARDRQDDCISVAMPSRYTALQLQFQTAIRQTFFVPYRHRRRDLRKYRRIVTLIVTGSNVLPPVPKSIPVLVFEGRVPGWQYQLKKFFFHPPFTNVGGYLHYDTSSVFYPRCPWLIHFQKMVCIDTWMRSGAVHHMEGGTFYFSSSYN
jgi:hypothetical protein